MIIIEGPDCAGKTTLARVAFAEYKCVHQGPYEKDVVQETINHVKRSWSRSTPNVVFDRLHVGERAYGPVYRNEDKLGTVGHRVLDRWLLSLGARLIVCLPPKEIVADEFRARCAIDGKEMFARQGVGAMMEVYERFQLAAHASSLPTFTYDYTKKQHLPTLLRWLDLARHTHQKPNMMPYGVGSFGEGNILLIGEQQNVGKGPGIDWVGTTGCCGWLTELLNVNDIPEDKLFWVNALQPGGDRTNPFNWIEKLQPRKVFAMGGVARTWCLYYGIEHTHVPHPAWWKRFRYHGTYPLITELHRALGRSV